MRLTVAPLILAMLFSYATGPAQAGPPDGFAAKAEVLVNRYIAEGEFSGVVLVADHGVPVLREPFGLANREWGAAVTPETVFRIGSTTKQFTAAAILQLAETGKLNLNDPIGKYYAAPPTWAPITLRQLLTHSSGIVDYVNTNGFLRGPARLDLSPEQLVALVRDQRLEFAPGSRFHYSNTDYVLLGMVIEKVSGQGYAQYLDQHLFQPLGMTHTAYDRSDEIVPGRASGYWRSDGVWKSARLMTTASLYAAGGVRSTADDLLRWDQALYASAPISAASITMMFTDYGNGYGLGSFVETRHGHRLWDHGGEVTGFSCAFERYPDDGVTVIVLSNIEGDKAEEIAKDLAGLYFGWSADH